MPVFIRSSVQSSLGPVVLYTDLVAGPTAGGEGNNGTYLSIFGYGFGAVQGNVAVTIGGQPVASIKYFGASRGLPWVKQITVQVGSLGGAAVGTALPIKVTVSGVDSNADLTFTPTSGRMFFVDYTKANGTGSFASPWNNFDSWYSVAQAGDHVIFRAATVNSVSANAYGSAMWTLPQALSGTSASPSALIGYPGETVTLQVGAGALQTGTCISYLASNYDALGNVSAAHDAADYMAVSNFVLRGGAQVLEGGGRGDSTHYPTTDFRCKGAASYRVVNNDMKTGYSGGTNTQTGAVTVKGDGCALLGNAIHDCGDAAQIWNNNHVVYHQVGASNVDIGWNYLPNNNVGHVIQTHCDFSLDDNHVYTNWKRHDNLITHTNSQNCRGMNVGITGNGSGGADYNNILVNVGQSFSGLSYYTGHVKVYNNTLWNVDADCISDSNQQVGGGTAIPAGARTLDVQNNILKPKNVTNAYLVIDATAPAATVADITTWDYNCCVGGASGRPVTGAHDISVVPTFANNAPDPTNPSAYDFHLVAGSSCIDSGSNTGATVARDIYGTLRPKGAALDIGATEQ